MSYAIIGIGGKQYCVREGERLLVERLPYGEGKTFHPDLLLLGGDGDPKLDAGELKGQQVTAKVAEHVLGPKVIVGKHKRRNGYRSRLTRIEIQTIGKKATRSSTPKKPAAEKKPAATKTTTTKDDA